jgi:hypothetical protein
MFLFTAGIGAVVSLVLLASTFADALMSYFF